jgi:hypothetical protein
MATSSNGDISTRPRAIHALMSGLIDYAGLFPPAKLAMSVAVANYAKYLGSPESWMLGRFILPVSKLEEFRAAARPLLPKRADPDDPAGAGGAWTISAISDGDLDDDLDCIFAFNHEHSEPKNGLALIDAIEIKVPPTSETSAAPSIPFIENALEIMAEGVYPFFELPAVSPKGEAEIDLRGAIAALSGADAAAKVRTGGVTPEAIPASRAVAQFIVACAQADVPFKATAGLHHAVRAEFDLTYEKGCPRAVMHGFLNVFVAAAMVQAFRLGAEDAARILEEKDAKAFVFADDAIAWGPGRLDLEQIEKAREMFALSYGSCSFEEPVQELRTLGLI